MGDDSLFEVIGILLGLTRPFRRPFDFAGAVLDLAGDSNDGRDGLELKIIQTRQFI